jgi:simple sugar transport system permease protein
VLLLVTLAMLAVIMAVDPGAVSASLAGDIVRAAMDNMALALGVLLILLSGGIDVSFTAIAIFGGYATVTFMLDHNLDGGLWPFVVATLIGSLLGLGNALLVAGFRLQTLIATLAMQSIVWGSLLAFVGSTYHSTLPPALARTGQSQLLRLGDSPVSTLVVPVALIAVSLALVLRWTMFGRSVYAIGGDAEAAKRAGIRVGRVQTLVFAAAGALAGFAGMVHVTLVQHASPYELVGTELSVIAAVVIGGASDAGGRGSVQGTVLGVLLISLITNSLVRLGVPSFWQQAVEGLLILAGVAIQAQSRRRRTHRSPILEAR